MSSSNCCFLTCIYVSQEAGQVVWYSHLSKNFPQFVVNHTIKGFGIVNKAEIDVFLELFCLFDDPMDVGHLIFCSSSFSKSNLNFWKFSVPVLLKPGLENFEHYFASMWNECNCEVVQTFLGFPSGSVGKESVQCRRPGSELEKEMTTLSSILAWRIPWTEEPGRLQSMGSQRAGHDCVANLFEHFWHCPSLGLEWKLTFSSLDVAGRGIPSRAQKWALV